MNPYRISLLFFLGTVGVFFIVLTIICNSPQMPGPRISDSVAFNQKALWLRKALQRSHSADILIVGSSMGVNNVDGEELAKLTGTRAIINGSSWGLDIGESAKMVRSLIDEHSLSPKVVIIPVYFGDFTRHLDKGVNWNVFNWCLSSPFVLPLYLQSPDWQYYRQTYREQIDPKAVKRETYESLHFDDSGGVPLSCDSFAYRKERWDMYQTENLAAAQWNPDAIASLTSLNSYLAAKKIRLLVVACPMRKVAEEKLGPQLETLLWSKVRAAIPTTPESFVLVTGTDFDDSKFVDSYHLNQCGAGLLVQQLEPQIKEIFESQKKR